MDSETTSFEYLFERFYKRVEKDETFFEYYNVPTGEAMALAQERAEGCLIDALDRLCSVGDLEVDFSDYSTEELNFKTTARENNLIVNLMFQVYMERDLPLLHAFQINFTPSDLNIITPSTERSTYTNFIEALNIKNEYLIDDYKNRDRTTGKLKSTINYAAYGDI